MGQTATLFRARSVAFGNARRAQTGAFRPAVVFAVLLGAGCIIGLGELAATSLLATPTDMAAPSIGKRAPVAGDGALEAAFWLGSLLSSFFAFRVMESLFRSPQIRALELLPVRPLPILLERTANAGVEAIALGALLSLFFVPLVWHGQTLLWVLCTVVALGATLCTAAVTIGTNAWFGAQYGGSSGIGDGYGGQGGAFIYSPMVSFALAVGCLMMLQLGAREVLHDGRLSNAFWLAVGIAAGVAVGTLGVGARHFVASYHRVAAFFREADEVGFRAVMDYQQSTWAPLRFEALAGPGRAIFRRHVLQFGRRFPVARSLAVIGTVGAAIGSAMLSADAYPTWIAAIIPAALFVLLERPFTRIFDERLGGATDAFLPLHVADTERATFAWWVYEVSRLAVPYAVVLGVARQAPLAAVIAAVLPVAIAAAVAAVRRFGARSAPAMHAAASLSLLATSALAAVNLALGTALAVVLGAVCILSTVGVRR